MLLTPFLIQASVSLGCMSLIFCHLPTRDKKKMGARKKTAAPLWWWWCEAAIFLCVLGNRVGPRHAPQTSSVFFHILNEDWWKNVTTTYLLTNNIYAISFYNRKKDVKLYHWPYRSLFTLCYACHVNTNVDLFFMIIIIIICHLVCENLQIHGGTTQQDRSVFIFVDTFSVLRLFCRPQ